MVDEFSPSCLVAPILEQLVLQMAEIIKGWSSGFLRLQNKSCQTEDISKSVLTVESGRTGKSGARGRLIEKEKGKRPQAGRSEGSENGSKRWRDRDAVIRPSVKGKPEELPLK